MSDDSQNQDESFEEATQNAQGGIISEFIGFMRENTKWWLIPFLVVFGLLGLLLIFSATGAAPFIYTLF